MDLVLFVILSLIYQVRKGHTQCQEGEYQCKTSKICIAKTYWCDRFPDCSNEEDELPTPKPDGCGPGHKTNVRLLETGTTRRPIYRKRHPFVNTLSQQSLHPFEGSFNVTRLNRDHINYYTHVEIWTGMGRRPEQWICDISERNQGKDSRGCTTKKINYHPYDPPVGKPDPNISYTHFQYSLSVPVKFEHGAKRLWAFGHGNAKDKDQAKFHHDLGILPVFYRVKIYIDEGKTTESEPKYIGDGSSISLPAGVVVVNVKICLELPSPHTNLSFTTSFTKELYDHSRDVTEQTEICNTHSDITLPDLGRAAIANMSDLRFQHKTAFLLGENNENDHRFFFLKNYDVAIPNLLLLITSLIFTGAAYQYYGKIKKMNPNDIAEESVRNERKSKEIEANNSGGKSSGLTGSGGKGSRGKSIKSLASLGLASCNGALCTSSTGTEQTAPKPPGSEKTEGSSSSSSSSDS